MITNEPQVKKPGLQVEDLDDGPLVDAYDFGLEVGASWSLRWTEFLYQTPEGEKVRRELSRDFKAWQKQELGLNSQEHLLGIREFIAKLFPLDVAAHKNAPLKTKSDLKQRRHCPKVAKPRPARVNKVTSAGSDVVAPSKQRAGDKRSVSISSSAQAALIRRGRTKATNTTLSTKTASSKTSANVQKFKNIK